MGQSLRLRLMGGRGSCRACVFRGRRLGRSLALPFSRRPLNKRREQGKGEGSLEIMGVCWFVRPRAAPPTPKGWHSPAQGNALGRTFRALPCGVAFVPRALPWAGECHPFGVKKARLLFPGQRPGLDNATLRGKTERPPSR